VNAVNYATNNACFGFNIRTAESRTAANYYFIATNNNTSACNGMRKSSGGAQYNFAVNNSSLGMFIGWNLGGQTGRFHIERTGSSTGGLYQNGISVQSGANLGTALPTSNFFVLAGNNGSGAAQNFTQAELSYFYLGASGILASIDARLATYLTSVGA